jgi:hypothetical protein
MGLVELLRLVTRELVFKFFQHVRKYMKWLDDELVLTRNYDCTGTSLLGRLDKISIYKPFSRV